MKYLKKYWLIIVLAILAVFAIVLKILLPKQVAPLENIWQEIQPGRSDQKQLEKFLGTPLRADETNGEVIYYYPYTEQNWPTKIRVDQQNNKVKFIEAYFPPPEQDFEYFINKFGNADKVLFGPHAQAGFSVFVYLQRGVAIVANPQSNLVLEAWYFTPTTLNQFIQLSGVNLTEEPIIQF